MTQSSSKSYFLSTSGFTDLMTAAYSWRIWCSLAFQDILLRYRGSVIGPFWITISTAITVYTMGFLYGTLFGMDRSTYLPYFTTGIITWQFISMIINESTKIFLESKHFMENIRLPCTVYMFRLILRNAIVWAHNLPVFLSIAFLYHMDVNFYILLLIPGFLIFCLNAVLYGTIIAFLSARYPDIGTIVSNILQVIFFVTPIMWVPSALPSHLHIYIKLNPFSYFVSLVRNPMLGLPFSNEDLVAVGILAFYDPNLTFDEMHHINFDWYAPKNAHRHSVEEVKHWCLNNHLTVNRLIDQPSGITVVARKN